MKAPTQAMGMGTRVVGYKEVDGKGGKGDNKGNEEGNGEEKAMGMVTTRAMARATRVVGNGEGSG